MKLLTWLVSLRLCKQKAEQLLTKQADNNNNNKNMAKPEEKDRTSADSPGLTVTSSETPTLPRDPSATATEQAPPQTVRALDSVCELDTLPSTSARASALPRRGGGLSGRGQGREDHPSLLLSLVQDSVPDMGPSNSNSNRNRNRNRTSSGPSAIGNQADQRAQRPLPVTSTGVTGDCDLPPGKRLALGSHKATVLTSQQHLTPLNSHQCLTPRPLFYHPDAS